ncbi:bacillithiol biosynthesis cysteine-adding enzyme BshC [Flavobacterium luminosum]|uniref:Putative cysteine ligase BshC n=1 Tax=Flavobacterium luminosum TaxID=2949086 RepID=A0ABT0TLR1_9FLAO|nr:bacillithiol biosynthesis cysteine-adding enzyme BshC [Flavobacterium sp. HXWNR70]MCL9808428.1 bacillithiol biosynthesis cysteine-adding enzyme BshC [Flavobacterium sp. HXWNR70]
MPSDCINYQNSGYFSKLIVDYLNQKHELQSLYYRFPTLDNFLAQIEEKQNNFPIENRAVLVESLLQQNKNISLSESTTENIESLRLANTFTITTGHQLNLFTGPLYFIYKIVSVINLCKQLKSEYPEFNFVPVYWMATEDHDFEEINHFKIFDKKLSWNRQASGPVGRLTTEGLQNLFEEFSELIGTNDNAKQLKNWFQKAYLEHENLTEATRYLVNEIFKEYGLVILDGDDQKLKQLFAPYVSRELQEQVSYQQVSETLKHFSNYEAQVNPRELNLFYIEDNLRERIIIEKGKFKINNTILEFTQDEILSELKNHPEKFSPNVILRPLYQEIILPNLCYVGGGGEIAYWLELKKMFDAFKITFPMLLLRNSVLVSSEKQAKKADQLQLSWEDLFMTQQKLENKKTIEFSQFVIDFSQQKENLKQQFEQLHAIAAKTDPSFIGAVKAQEVKQLKGLENLEKRLLKAEKRIHRDKLDRIFAIQNELFPNGGLQERQLNFSVLYKEYGDRFINQLIEVLKPLEQDFTIITL